MGIWTDRSNAAIRPSVEALPAFATEQEAPPCPETASS